MTDNQLKQLYSYLKDSFSAAHDGLLELKKILEGIQVSLDHYTAQVTKATRKSNL